jgi:hypothetical protein
MREAHDYAIARLENIVNLRAKVGPRPALQHVAEAGDSFQFAFRPVNGRVRKKHTGEELSLPLVEYVVEVAEDHPLRSGRFTWRSRLSDRVDWQAAYDQREWKQKGDHRSNIASRLNEVNLLVGAALAQELPGGRLGAIPGR